MTRFPTLPPITGPHLLGNLLGSLRYLGQCSCGEQHVSLHARVYSRGHETLCERCGLQGASRAALAKCANDLRARSYRDGAPILRPESELGELVTWLLWADPNGEHGAHVLDSAWAALAQVLSDE